MYTFNGPSLRRHSKDPKMKLLKIMAKNAFYEVEVSATDTSNNEGAITKTCDYHLICDKVRSEFIPSQRYIYASLGCYYLHVVEGLQNSQTETFREVYKSS